MWARGLVNNREFGFLIFDPSLESRKFFHISNNQPQYLIFPALNKLHFFCKILFYIYCL